MSGLFCISMEKRILSSCLVKKYACVEEERQAIYCRTIYPSCGAVVCQYGNRPFFKKRRCESVRSEGTSIIF